MSGGHHHDLHHLVQAEGYELTNSVRSLAKADRPVNGALLLVRYDAVDFIFSEFDC